LGFLQICKKKIPGFYKKVKMGEVSAADLAEILSINLEKRVSSPVNDPNKATFEHKYQMK
jgi:hypothetical protein